MTAVSFSTTRAVCARVKADLVAQGYAGTFGLGKKALASRSNPLIGSIAVIPFGDGPINAPRLTGGNPRACFTVVQPIQIHCWAAAAPQSDPNDQYDADLEAAEKLRNLVLRSFEIYIPGAKNGGRSKITGADTEGQFGVEIVATLGIYLETPDTTYQRPDTNTNVVTTVTEFRHGSTNPADWTDEAGGP